MFAHIQDCWINLDQVRKIEFENFHNIRVTYTDSEEDVFKDVKDDTSLSELKDYSHHIIPASPGFELIGFWPHPGWDPATHDIKAWLWREPVIAWQVYTFHADEKDFDHVAIGMQETSYNKDGEGWIAVLRPDGVVKTYNDPGFDRGVDEWIESVRKNWILHQRQALKLVQAKGLAD
jgi:hypothetical protein